VLGGLLALILAALGALWHQAAAWRRQAYRKKILRLRRPSTDGVSFHGPVILRRQGEALSALSARCPHLGCLINRAEGDRLVCACHGSRFSLDGRSQQGPALTDLKSLTIQQEPDSDSIIISID